MLFGPNPYTGGKTMQVFTTPQGKYKEISDKYKKIGEAAKVSMPIEYEGKLYREIVYNKTLLGKTRRNISGIIFVTEEGEYVSDSNITKELANLGYYIEIMLDDISIKELKNAIVGEKEILKQQEDYEYISKVLEEMKKSNIQGIDAVLTVFAKLPNVKKENNIAIENYIAKLESVKPEGFVYNKSTYEELYEYYREILIRIFQRVRLVSTAKLYYDDIKREGHKRKRSITFRFNSHEIQMGLNLLPFEIDHIKKILMVYERVADMRQEEYLKYLKAVEKSNVNARVELIR
jgi:uncharacterized protein YozE (UPF0346 family)